MTSSTARRALTGAYILVCLSFIAPGQAAEPAVPPLPVVPPLSASQGQAAGKTPPVAVPPLGSPAPSGKKNQAGQQLPPLSPAMKEAMIAYTEGYAALQSGHPKIAIARLQEAIKNNPREPQFHYLLAQAYGKVGNYPMRWFALRQAVRLNPNFKKAVRAFEQMWQVAVEKGALNVGTPAKRVKEALGEPDQKNPKGSVWVYGYRAVEFAKGKVYALLNLRGRGKLQPATEVFRFSFGDHPWPVIRRSISRDQSTLVYAPADQHPVHQQVTLRRLVDMKAKRSAEQLMQDMHKSLQARFPNVQWKVLQDGTSDVLFEWWLAGSGQPHQHQIIRLSSGAHDLYQLAYANQQDQLKPELRERWVQRLKAAKLEPLDQARQ